MPRFPKAVNRLICAAWARAGRRLAGLLLVLLATGCASLPGQVSRPVSRMLSPPADSVLGRIAANSTPDAELSGFRLLPSGRFALQTRLDLMRRAHSSLDLQYYHLQNDVVGRLVLRELRNAAQRGVRVRLLLDDLYTSEIDGLLQGLASHDNVEVRLFNPFPAGRGNVTMRVLSSLGDLGRINHRMHNKLFIADGAMAVVGGRNLGNEYYFRAESGNFFDLDALVLGAAVTQAGEVFDQYWNSLQVYPLAALLPEALAAADLREAFEAATARAAAAGAVFEALDTPTTDPLGYGPLADEFDDGRVGLIWGRATVYADPPDKVVGATRAYGAAPLADVVSTRYNVTEAMHRAKEEVLVISPYAIPGAQGLAQLRQARDRGVKITLITNSLATTDEPLVYVGYRRYRADLLRAGVDIYEFSPLRIQRVTRLKLLSLSGFRLHTKSAVIDRRVTYIGSMNFDPRSEMTNTEMALIIDSPELAREMLRISNLLKLEGANRVALNADGRVVWHLIDDDGETTVDTEPDTGFWTRLLLELMAPLAIEELL